MNKIVEQEERTLGQKKLKKKRTEPLRALINPVVPMRSLKKTATMSAKIIQLYPVSPIHLSVDNRSPRHGKWSNKQKRSMLRSFEKILKTAIREQPRQWRTAEQIERTMHVAPESLLWLRDAGAISFYQVDSIVYYDPKEVNSAIQARKAKLKN